MKDQFGEPQDVEGVGFCEDLSCPMNINGCATCGYRYDVCGRKEITNATDRDAVQLPF